MAVVVVTAALVDVAIYVVVIVVAVSMYADKASPPYGVGGGGVAVLMIFIC